MAIGFSAERPYVCSKCIPLVSLGLKAYIIIAGSIVLYGPFV